LTDVIFELIGAKCPVEIDESRLRPEASEVDRLCASSLLLSELTTWRQKIALREGLTRTIEWIGQNLGTYSIGSYAI